jgi:hypothetical protein
VFVDPELNVRRNLLPVIKLSFKHKYMDTIACQTLHASCSLTSYLSIQIRQLYVWVRPGSRTVYLTLYVVRMTVFVESTVLLYAIGIREDTCSLASVFSSCLPWLYNLFNGALASRSRI